MLAISIGGAVVQNQGAQKEKGVTGALLAQQQTANDALLASEKTTADNQAAASRLAAQATAEQRKKTLGASGRSDTIKTSPVGVPMPPPGQRSSLLGI